MDFVRRHALLLISTLLLTLSVQLMSLSVYNPALPRFGARLVDSVLFPLEQLYHSGFDSVRSVWTKYIWLLDVEHKRTALVERVKQLEAQNSRLMESERENDRLRSLLNFRKESGHHGVVATVVGRDPSNWVRAVTIDRGSLDGLRPGLAVVDGNAVVGQIVNVRPDSARVLLLTDTTSAIDVILQRSRAVGILEGRSHSATLRLRYVEKLVESSVSVGDRVIASGLDGVYPKGALVGVVHDVDDTASGMFYEIKVLPSVEVNQLENVLVLLKNLPANEE